MYIYVYTQELQSRTSLRIESSLGRNKHHPYPIPKRKQEIGIQIQLLIETIVHVRKLDIDENCGYH